jgi:hypothetical protein
LASRAVQKERARIKEKRAPTKFSDEGRGDRGWDPICEKELIQYASVKKGRIRTQPVITVCS